MQKSNMSRYPSKDAVLGFFENGDNKGEEISSLDWISTVDVEEGTKEISSCD